LAASLRVHHYNKENVRSDITTNSVEGAFSIFKRGVRGVDQHCSEKHLYRYLAKFEFRFSNREATGCNDEDRANAMLRGIVGKRLTIKQLVRGPGATEKNPETQAERSARFKKDAQKLIKGGDSGPTRETRLLIRLCGAPGRLPVRLCCRICREANK